MNSIALLASEHRDIKDQKRSVLYTKLHSAMHKVSQCYAQSYTVLCTKFHSVMHKFTQCYAQSFKKVTYPFNLLDDSYSLFCALGRRGLRQSSLKWRRMIRPERRVLHVKFSQLPRRRGTLPPSGAHRRHALTATVLRPPDPLHRRSPRNGAGNPRPSPAGGKRARPPEAVVLLRQSAETVGRRASRRRRKHLSRKALRSQR